MVLGDEAVPFGGGSDPSGASSDPAPGAPDAGATPSPPLDLDAIERDLAAVETALERLDAGTYWTDEVSGDPIPDHQLAADPLRRRSH